MVADGIGFFDCFPVVAPEGQKGMKYLLCDKLTQEQKDHLNDYDNTYISSCHYRYAPEIKHDVLIITK
jgi:hypothetical protein